MSINETPEMPEYKGAPLSPDRGPGLGCFWIQVVALVIFIILAPLSAVLNRNRGSIRTIGSPVNESR